LALSEKRKQNNEFYEVPGQVLKKILTMYPLRLEFGRYSESLLKVLLRAFRPMYSSLRSVSSGSVFSHLDRQTKSDGDATSEIKEFIKSCESLEFIVLVSNPKADLAIAIFSCTIEHCGHLSQLYFGDEIYYDNLRQWDEIFMPKEYPYDLMILLATHNLGLSSRITSHQSREIAAIY
jgi:hypothetical protein